ncbi:MAG TPA: hypothetical protein VL172_17265, partial [Kofleriaceae bacterium]|nr:hypothetical protein [Kofleriaceae bacterium]
MTTGAGDLWNGFVAAGLAEASDMDRSARALLSDELTAGARGHLLAELAHRAFTIGYQALLLGSEDLGRLALAAEKVAEGMRTGDVAATAVPILCSGLSTLQAALAQLAAPDKSG